LKAALQSSEWFFLAAPIAMKTMQSPPSILCQRDRYISITSEMCLETFLIILQE
jgi:hypothetical protein